MAGARPWSRSSRPPVRGRVHDITANVAEACRLDSPRRREVIRRQRRCSAGCCSSGQLENYAAVEGSAKSSAFAEGRRTYLMTAARSDEPAALTLVVARATNGVIGRDGDLPGASPPTSSASRR